MGVDANGCNRHSRAGARVYLVECSMRDGHHDSSVVGLYWTPGEAHDAAKLHAQDGGKCDGEGVSVADIMIA